MSFMKRFFICILVLLLFISIYKDLTDHKETKDPTIVNYHSNTDYTIMHMKVQPGDTVLSIIEQINQNRLQKSDITQVLSDFQSLNPTVDPYNIYPYAFYYFPKYNN